MINDLRTTLSAGDEAEMYDVSFKYAFCNIDENSVLTYNVYMKHLLFWLPIYAVESTDRAYCESRCKEFIAKSLIMLSNKYQKFLKNDESI